MCVVCRERLSKDVLIRFVKYNGNIILDESGKADGRGAYLCTKEKCIEKALKTNVFSKSFKCNADKDTISESIKKYVAKTKN